MPHARKNDLLAEKLAQASQFVAESGLDVWLTLVRETAEGSDPILPFLIEGSLTWISALLVAKNGARYAIIGHYDADALKESGQWTEVIPYNQDIKPHLLEKLEEMCGPDPRIGINFSVNDEKCDGLTHGLFLLLNSILKHTRFESKLESAESICMALRGQKTDTEVARMKSAIAKGDEIFEEISRFAKVGVSEREVFDYVHSLIDSQGLGYAWSPVGDPIVNSGPDSMVGHGIPSSSIKIAPGHVFHIDLGVIHDGYSSDIQRSWYVGDEIPPDVERGFQSVRNAIIAGFKLLKPGVQGWQVDEAARNSLVASGYDEYLHALGHQVGRVAHDGGALLGPRWERYGDRPFVPISEGEVYTLELGVILPNRGYLGLEEMVRVTAHGAEWLSSPQTEIWLLK